ncbi:MAG TPA: membrane protein insertase YidC [Pyrinomonadaceae bacterium]|jgi:YidC/Oxa1 family membrane protein insertase
MRQQRFVLALVISAAILLVWSYLFPAPSPKQINANNAATPEQQQQPTASSPSPQATATANTTASGQPPQAEAVVPSTQDTTPQRTIKITSPLYEVKLDSHGAVATSWLLKSLPADNNKPSRPLYTVASTKSDPQPLQLISPEGLKRGEAPLRLSTGDAKIDDLLSSRNYAISGAEGEGDEISINLAPGESKRIDFTLRDESMGLDATKSIIFNADRYITDIEVKLNRGGQQVPQAKLLVGPAIGDQGITHYSFYSVAPEAIAVVEGEVKRIYGQAVNENKESPDRQVLNGPVTWAGIGDTYFAMIAVPSKKTEGLEIRTAKYEYQVNGNKEARYLITALVPIPTDGSPTWIYTGPKDHYLLTNASDELSKVVSQASGAKAEVDLEQAIDYGFLSSLSRPLAVPILWSIQKLYALTGSYGVAIILFTIVIYSLFFPLKWRSSKSMKKAQKLAPRMKELQEKIKGMKQDDPRLKELQMEQLRLMKEGNPLGGCLPLLIQMPFLFALYRAITISIDFRQASFLWIPDLSAAEPYTIHMLPILFAASMIVLQLITPAPSADPLQRKMMAIGMPLFMLYMLWSAPAGLLVYWLVGNVVGFGQQVLINRLTKSEDDEEPPKKKAEARPPKKLSTTRVSQA